MRRPLIAILLALFCVTVAAPAASATSASAAAATSDPTVAAKYAASWLAQRVNPQGFIPQAADPSQPNLSTSAQAVLALASAGVGRAQVDALLAYLGGHVDDFVVKSGNDDPGSLAYLVLGAVAAGSDPTNFGTNHVNLVARLQATQQANGLFGASDPTFDGAFRQGLSLMALTTVGLTDAAANDWLAAQQCADGSWTAFRSDTSTPCPAVDPATFTGPDTNSTALAVLGLHAQGRGAPAASGVRALLAVRDQQGGWGFLSRSDQPLDANSTGLVLAALRAVNGSRDAQGTTALLGLQLGCDADPADAGGVAFQDPSAGPDALATAQATPALADVSLPLARAAISDDLVTCAAAAPTPTTAATAETTPDTTDTSTAPVAGAALPRTGTPTNAEAFVALLVLGVGIGFVEISRRRT